VNYPAMTEVTLKVTKMTSFNLATVLTSSNECGRHVGLNRTLLSIGQTILILAIFCLPQRGVWAKEIKAPTPIVVIDSGIDYNHPALQGHVDLSNAWNFNSGNDDVLDRPHQRLPQFIPIPSIDQQNETPRFRQFLNVGAAILQNGVELLRALLPIGAPGHGTHVSGIALQNCLYQCEIIPLKVFGESALSISHITQAVEHAVDLNYPIVNMSLGIFSKIVEESGSLSDMDQLEELMTVITESTDTLFVVASGNDGLNLDDYDHKIIPAMLALDHVITVGAINSEDEIADFSNYGERFVDIYAPGVNILSTWPDGEFREVSGTSMAAPVISARAALLLQELPELSAQEIKIILTREL
jgi:subtilisin family serine protease